MCYSILRNLEKATADTYSQLLACLSLVLLPRRTSRQCQTERSHSKPCNPITEEPASLQASSPDICRTDIHRPRPLGASFHDHEKLDGALPNGTMADPAGNKPVPRFSPEPVRAHHTALAFSLLFQAVKRDDVLTSLSVPRSEQRAEQAQTETQTKKIPHTRLPISLRTLLPLAAGDGVWCLSHSTGEDGQGTIIASSGQIRRGAHPGIGMRRDRSIFLFSLLPVGSRLYGPGVRAIRERILISLLEDERLVYYNRKVDRLLLRRSDNKEMPQNRQKKGKESNSSQPFVLHSVYDCQSSRSLEL